MLDENKVRKEIERAGLTNQSGAAMLCIIEENWKELHDMKAIARKATLVRIGIPLTYDNLVRRIISKEIYKKGKR